MKGLAAGCTTQRMASVAICIPSPDTDPAELAVWICHRSFVFAEIVASAPRVLDVWHGEDLLISARLVSARISQCKCRLAPAGEYRPSVLAFSHCVHPSCSEVQKLLPLSVQQVVQGLTHCHVSCGACDAA